MKTYVLNYPRPVGVEPRISFVKPDWDEEVDDSGYGPSLLEFNSVKEALQYIIDFNDSCEYLKMLTIDN